MAKRGGIFQAFRNLFRFAIWALAGVLAAAIWFNWQSGEDVAAVVPEVVLPEVEADVEPVTEEVAAVEEAAKDAVTPVTEAVEEIADEAEEAITQATEAVEAQEETVAETVEAVEEAVVNVEEGVVEAAEGTVADVASAVEDAASKTLTTDPTTITIPGTDTTFTLINAFRRDNGAIEVTTQQTTGGSGATLWLVTCAPLAVGTIATGPSAGELSARVEDPEMTEIPLSDPRAMIAGTACGVMR